MNLYEFLVSSRRRSSSAIRSLGCSVKNWLGQILAVDDLVYRGARAGDTSYFELGFVVELNQGSKQDKIRVEWFTGANSYNRGTGRPLGIHSSVSLQEPFALVRYDKSLLDVDAMNIRPEDLQLAKNMLQ